MAMLKNYFLRLLESYLESFKAEPSKTPTLTMIALESYLESFKVWCFPFERIREILLESYLESFKGNQ